MNKKQEFLNIVKEKISRCGIEDLLTYLDTTDFYISPASTRYHGAYEGGLLDHSLNVYYCLLDEMSFIYGKNWSKKWSEETVAIVSLFHDLCKIGRYIPSVRNVKNKDTGVWEQVQCYEYNQNCFNMGHAAASLQILYKFIMLTDEEAQAIYWHMGAFDTSQYSTVGQLSEAYSQNTLALALHRADMLATHVVENDKFTPIEE